MRLFKDLYLRIKFQIKTLLLGILTTCWSIIMIVFIKNNYDEMSSMGYTVFDTIDHLSTGQLEIYISRSELIILFDPDYKLLLELKRCGSSSENLFIVLPNKKDGEVRDYIFYRYAKTIIRCGENECKFVFDSLLSLMNDSESFGANIVDMKNHFKSVSEIHFKYVMGDVTIDKIKNISIGGNVKSLLTTIFYDDNLLFDDIELWFKWLNDRWNAINVQSSYRRKLKNTPSLSLFLSI